MLEVIPNMPENVLGVNAKGKVTGEDYDRVLIPAVEDLLKRHKKIRVLYQLGPDFSGFTTEAMWDDAKVGIRHITAFEKIAVVSDVDWIVAAVKIFAFVIPCPVKVFSNEEYFQARAWVTK